MHYLPGSGCSKSPMRPADATLAAAFPLFRRGKVRDLYDLGEELLIVASDRISAFDVVLPTSVPGKGRLLTAISDCWCTRTTEIVPNHRSARKLGDLTLPGDVAQALAGRTTIARKADRIDVECVIRGYLAGSGWVEYQRHGLLAGEDIDPGLGRASRLSEPRFTPAIKNDDGHDENISRHRLNDIVGVEVSQLLEDASRRLYEAIAADCARRGLILADTKFEFGWIDGTFHLIDELCTPDSSRFWDRHTWQEGREPESFDKQPLRDWLERSDWDKSEPGPPLPPDVVEATSQRYRMLAERVIDDPTGSIP